MKTLPDNLMAYKRTPEFTESSVPSGLLHRHNTKEGTWGKIVIIEGTLTYKILEPTIEEVLLSPNQPGIIEPTIKHKIIPNKGVRFYVEFYGDRQSL